LNPDQSNITHGASL